MSFITWFVGFTLIFLVIINWIIIGWDAQLIKWFLVGIAFLSIKEESGK